MLLRVFILTLLMLAGCQTIDADSTPTTAPDKYEAVIDGGLGINFSDPLSKLIKMGFEENTRPTKQYEVGQWNIPVLKNEGFFNFGMKVSTSPTTGRIYSIQGMRFYSAKTEINHFSSCEEDLNLFRTKIISKYPSLHVSYESGPNVTREYSSISLYEGKGTYEYITSPRYFGRSIYLACSIQTIGEEVIGSMLFVTYSEGYEANEALRAEQKRIFAELSGARLKEKGISEKDL